jgi:hypothetical protein
MSTCETLDLQIDLFILLPLLLYVIRNLIVDEPVVLLPQLLFLTTFLLHVLLLAGIDSDKCSCEFVS